jgi:acyl-CoA dehydrogenase
MSEPHVGSDLGNLASTAVISADASHYVVNGSKMWISAGSVCDLVVVACLTDPKKKYKGISLLVLERGMPGFETAKRFSKLGKLASDTCLLTMKNVKVPAQNLVGLEGQGFNYMMQNLSKERLSIAVGSVAAARRALALTVNYVRGREVESFILVIFDSFRM